MKKTIVYTALTLMAAICCLADSVGLAKRVSVVSLSKWNYESLINFLGSRSGYSIHISPDTFHQAVTNTQGQIGFAGRFHDISVRDAFYWTLYFANASANITNSTMMIYPSTDDPVLPDELTPPDGQPTVLPETTAMVTLEEDEWVLIQLLEYLSHRSDIRRFIIDPSVLTTNQNITVSFDNVPATLAFSTILEKTGLEAFTYGEVTYYKMKQ